MAWDAMLALISWARLCHRMTTSGLDRISLFPFSSLEMPGPRASASWQPSHYSLCLLPGLELMSCEDLQIGLAHIHDGEQTGGGSRHSLVGIDLLVAAS